MLWVCIAPNSDHFVWCPRYSHQYNRRVQWTAAFGNLHIRGYLRNTSNYWCCEAESSMDLAMGCCAHCRLDHRRFCIHLRFIFCILLWIGFNKQIFKNVLDFDYEHGFSSSFRFLCLPRVRRLALYRWIKIKKQMPASSKRFTHNWTNRLLAIFIVHFHKRRANQRKSYASDSPAIWDRCMKKDYFDFLNKKNMQIDF